MTDDRDEDDPAGIAADFNAAVNMTPAELERWLGTDESKSVGWAGGEAKHEAGGPESVGHHSGREIVRIKRTKKADLTPADYAHMKKVVGYVHRHLAQRPSKEAIPTSRWRYSLMNWGCDPLKT
jgi:hypothetical protein